jgi:hypothetical protein
MQLLPNHSIFFQSESAFPKPFWVVNTVSGTISGEFVTWLHQTPHEKSWRFLSKTDTCPAASCGSRMFQNKVCFVTMNSFFSSRSNFPAKQNKFWWMLGRDIPFSARKCARSKKKESPASFCIECHVFSLLFKKAQITFRQRQW